MKSTKGMIGSTIKKKLPKNHFNSTFMLINQNNKNSLNEKFISNSPLKKQIKKLMNLIE